MCTIFRNYVCTHTGHARRDGFNEVYDVDTSVDVYVLSVRIVCAMSVMCVCARVHLCDS